MEFVKYEKVRNDWEHQYLGIGETNSIFATSESSFETSKVIDC